MRYFIAIILAFFLVTSGLTNESTSRATFNQSAQFIASGGGPSSSANYKSRINIVGQSAVSTSSGGGFISLIGAIPTEPVLPAANSNFWRIF